MEDTNTHEPSARRAVAEDVLRALNAQIAECRKQSFRTTHDLEFRVKELSCLYTVASLLQQCALPLPETVHAILNAITSAYQYPDITCARAFVEGMAFHTPNFRPTPWRQASPLLVGDQTAGTIEVFYLEERPTAAEGPFLTEERRLLNAVAEHVVRHLRERRERSALEVEMAHYRQQAVELELIYRTAPVGLCVLDREFRYVRVNERLAEANGSPLDAHVGRATQEVAPDVADRMEPVLQQVLSTGNPVFDIEFSAERPSRPGVVRHWLNHVMPLPLANGTLYGFSVVVEEITERKWLEETRQREQQFRTLAENSTDVVVRFNRELRRIYANTALEKILGRPLAAVLGKTNRELGLPDELADFMDRHLSQVFATGREQSMELTLPTPQGVRAFDSRLIPELDARGEVITVLGISRDITDRKQAEEELRESEGRYRRKATELETIY